MARELLRIAEGSLEVELLPSIGGRLHRIRAFGHDLLRTPDDPEAHAADPFFWGAYAMAPWCNRLETVATTVGRRTVRPKPNFSDGTAIHGQVVQTAWSVEPDGNLSVRGGGDGWPWPYEVTQGVSIVDGSLRIELRLTNLADEPMPAGLGLHPWFLRPLDVRIAASRVLPSNLDPGAALEPVTGDLDLRHRRPIPDDLDATWTDLDDPPLDLRWPGLGIEASLRVRPTTGLAIAVASPADLDAVAIEPQTHVPQGLRRLLHGAPGGLRLLAPRATMRLTMEWLFRR
jgi:aldose 1-epimerase